MVKNKPRLEKFILPFESICGCKFDIGVPNVCELNINISVIVLN